MGITRGFSGRAARRAQGLGGIGSWTKKKGVGDVGDVLVVVYVGSVAF